MTDEMAVYAGVAESYRDFPLSALRHLQSILSVEIEERLHSFGITNVEKGVGNVGDVGGKNVDSNAGNNVVIGNFGGNKA